MTKERERNKQAKQEQAEQEPSEQAQTPEQHEQEQEEQKQQTEQEQHERERKHREDLKRIANFRLMDDDFMTKCFDGCPEAVELVLRIILDMPDLTVVEVRTQVFVENLLHRSVRLDVKAVDSRGRWMNIEIQRRDHGAGRKRARYNSSIMDAELLEKSEDFDNLPETWVIFITERDVLGRGLPLYRIDRTIAETREPFGDGSHIVYVNGSIRDETPLGWLMHDFACTRASEMHYPVLAERVRFYKESKKGVAVMCKAMEDLWKDGIKEGTKQGIKQGSAETMQTMARRMIRDGRLAPEDISLFSGLSVEEVRRLSVPGTA